MIGQEPIAVSVVIPARNEEGLIREALLSVGRLEFQADRLECVVVDNASTDSTVKAALEVAASSTVPIRIVSEERPGVAAAKNAGAEAARGEVLVFVDADSEVAPNLAEEIVRAHRSGLPVGSVKVVANGGGPIDQGFFQLMEFGKRYFGIRAQMLYCDRSLFRDVGGFDVRLRLGEDVDFLERAGRYLRKQGGPRVHHLQASEIATSPRRLARNHHLSMMGMFGRWLLAFVGVGRKRPY